MHKFFVFFVLLVGCTNPVTPTISEINNVTPRVAQTGDSVILRGKGFVAGSNVSIGTSNAAIISSTTTELIVTMPNLPIGEYDLVLRQPNGTETRVAGPAVLGADNTDLVAREIIVTGVFTQSEISSIASSNGYQVLQLNSTSIGDMPSCNRSYAALRDTRGRSTSTAINELQAALQIINPAYEANPRSILAGSQTTSTKVYPQGTIPIPTPSPTDINLANIKVAILDSGVSGHPSLGTLETGHNLTNFDNPADPRAIATDVSDLGIYGNSTTGHGTGVAALISASSIGLSTGYAVGTPIQPIKVCQTTNNKNQCDGMDVVLGICQAVARGTNIINLSLGGKQPFRALKQVLLETSNKGISIIAAAGNNGIQNNPPANYPAAYALEIPGLIAVAATENNGTNWVGSSYSTPGNYVTIAAPGTNETAIVTDNGVAGYGTATLEGTSFATPIVSAAVARVKAKNPTWTPAQIKSRLENTAQSIPCEKNKCGAGLLDITAAVQ